MTMEKYREFLDEEEPNSIINDILKSPCVLAIKRFAEKIPVF